jgi:hypothetical protein
MEDYWFNKAFFINNNADDIQRSKNRHFLEDIGKKKTYFDMKYPQGTSNDTYWADKIFLLTGNSQDFDAVMRVYPDLSK